MLAAGDKLGNYRVISALGAGGMGEVYLAEDPRLNRRVAIKILSGDFDEDKLHRFEREACAASALNHPNIITIYEIGTSGDTHFIAAEYVEGETLYQCLEREPMNLESVLKVAVQVVSALDIAHRAGIIHRDIKPENVMIRPDGLVKLLDFGIAKLAATAPSEGQTTKAGADMATTVKANTTPGMVIGTVDYMSPEQACGKFVDARTDIFSFGVMLYEMLAGERPFQGENALDTIASILHKEAAPLEESKTPRELRQVVEKCLQKDRAERYQTARDLLADLKNVPRDLEFRDRAEQTLSPSAESSTRTLKPAIITADPTPLTADSNLETGKVKNREIVFFTGAAILLFALVGVGIWYLSNRPTNANQIESIAVLPFVNESGNADVEYLSDGMTESLINSLLQLPKLSVKARSSVFRYKGKEVEPQKIGKELNVQALLNGRVVQRGDDLTLYLSLDDVQTGNQIWGKQYNQKLSDLVSLQSEIAHDVSNNLQTRLSGADEQRLAKNYTGNTEAYQHYLKGRFYWNKRTGKDLQKAIEYFEQAITVDPNYALAYAGLADSYALLSPYLAAPPREVMPKARDAAQKALAFDDQLVEAHAALGLILNTYDYDFAGAEREFKRAIELNPNYATAHQFYGELLMYLDRREEAETEFRRALELDPLSLIINRQYGESLLYARKYEASITQFKKTLDFDSNFAAAHVSLSLAYQLTGKSPESIEEYAKFQELIGEKRNAALIRQSFAEGGWTGFWRAMTGENRLSNATPYVLASWYAKLGEKDKAFEELNKSYEIREYFLVLLKVDPRLDDLRSDPRFEDLLRRVGFPQ